MAAGWSAGTDSYLRLDYDEKRSNPSISASSGSNYLRGFFGGDATLYATTIASNGTPYRKSSEMYIAHASGSNSPGEAGWWRINDSGMYIDVDAEL